MSFAVACRLSANSRGIWMSMSRGESEHLELCVAETYGKGYRDSDDDPGNYAHHDAYLLASCEPFVVYSGYFGVLDFPRLIDLLELQCKALIANSDNGPLHVCLVVECDADALPYATGLNLCFDDRWIGGFFRCESEVIAQQRGN